MKFSTKALRICQWSLLALGLSFSVSCESTDDDGRKVVGPKEDISGLPWNRPQGFESNSGLGSIIPQSH